MIRRSYFLEVLITIKLKNHEIKISVQTGAGTRGIFSGGVLSEALTRVSPSAL
jgi:hypothetical protein